METPSPVWPFVPYEKIPERLEEWNLQPSEHRALARLPWVVTEKIHGANFSFVSDGVTLRCAKRKAFLAAEDDFYGFQEVAARLGPAVLRLAQCVRARWAGVQRVQLCGELFGGGYSHPEIAPVLGVQPVQTGVEYAPGIEFCAFDVAIFKGEQRQYLEYDLARALCREFELLWAEPLQMGSLTEALGFPLGFESTLPARLGLPPLPPGNRAEGVVLKPVRALTLPGREEPLRPILKRKLADFAEDERFHLARKWTAPARPPRSDPEESLRFLLAEVSARATGNRLDSALSKSGPLRPGDSGRAREVFQLLVEDILADLNSQFASLLETLSAAQQQALREQLQAEVRSLLSANIRRG